MEHDRLSIEKVRRRNTLHYLISRLCGREISFIQPEIRDILESALAELFFIPVTHPGKIVSSAVDRAKKKIRGNGHKLVNAVLRKAAQQTLAQLLPEKNDPEYLSLKYSFPQWIISEISAAFADPEQIMQHLNSPPPASIRLYPADPFCAESSLLSEGYELQKGHFPCSSYLVSRKDLLLSSAWKNGLVYFQDEASMMIGELASKINFSEGFDMCAAPGGKITHLSQLFPEKSFFASDTAERIPLLSENISRMNLKNISVAVPEKHQCDLILLDAPCSSLGIIRRHPEIKWTKKPGDPEKISEIQLSLLEKAFDLLKPGGHLIYSVCTFTRCETTALLDRFCKSCSSARIISADYNLSGNVISLPAQISPGFLNMDGFFAAVLGSGLAS